MMRHRQVRLAAAGFLAVALAAAALLIASRSHWFRWVGPDGWVVRSRMGVLFVTRFDPPRGPAALLHVYVSERVAEPELTWWFGRSEDTVWCGGWITVDRYVNPSGGNQSSVAVVLWPFVAVFGVSSLTLLGVAWRLGRRPLPGHCPACGYDLKGLPKGRCPECGPPANAALVHGLRAIAL